MIDEQGIIEFEDGTEPTPEAIAHGFMTYRITGINPATGNRTAEARVTAKGMERLARYFAEESS
jgi:hypothetical protein